MLSRSRTLLSPIARANRAQRCLIRNSSTETKPTPPSPAQPVSQNAPSQPPPRQPTPYELALAASRADAARQHAALVDRTRKLNQARPSDRNLYLTALALILVSPPVVYYWWCHRAEHMGQKKQNMLKELAERRREWAEKHR